MYFLDLFAVFSKSIIFKKRGHNLEKKHFLEHNFAKKRNASSRICYSTSIIIACTLSPDFPGNTPRVHCVEEQNRAEKTTVWNRECRFDHVMIICTY